MGLLSFQLGKIYDRIMYRFEKRVLKSRRQALLNQVQGTVIEIGAGTGANFPYYPSGTKVLAIEPNLAMIAQAQAKCVHLNQDIHWINAPVDEISLLDFHDEGQVEAIVSTLVWCTLPNPLETIEHLKDWLKPNGCVYLIEHICPKSQPARWTAHFVQPIWGKMAGNCHLNRDTDQLFRNAGFVPIREEYFRFGLPFYEAILRLE